MQPKPETYQQTVAGLVRIVIKLSVKCRLAGYVEASDHLVPAIIALRKAALSITRADAAKQEESKVIEND